MLDTPDHTGLENIGVAALKINRGIRLGQRIALPQVVPQQQRINLGRIAAHTHVLIGKRQHAGLQKMAA